MITLVLPTYNEKDNISLLVRNIIGLGIRDMEIIIIDDNSPDGTGKIADSLAKKYKNVKAYHRSGKLGLGSAIKYGFEKSHSDFVGVMDTDFSHDTNILRKIFKEINKGADFVIGSRYVEHGGIQDWPLKRRVVSKIATCIVRPLTGINDPMSGFFFVRKSVFKNIKINPESCKICLDLIVRGNYKKIVEVPYIFTDRMMGRTKIFTPKEIIKYIKHITFLYLYTFINKIF